VSEPTAPQGDQPAHVVAPVDDLAGAPILESEKKMTLLELALVLSSVSLAAVAQLMLRHGMQHAKLAGGGLVGNAVTSPHVVGGLAIFAVSAVLWLAALSRVPLSRAYPFNAISYVGILVAARFVQHEDVTPTRWVGAALVVTGLLLVVQS
jgi:drug/metabolite transporter (DMT)-like permease